ncbi:MAG: hypothetical protein ACM3VZ_08245 [Acidobacteriota bacterium]
MSRPPSSPRRRQMLLGLAATPLALIAPRADAMNATVTSLPPAPSEVTTGLIQAQLLGRANLRFFGLLVYEARLWTAPAFDPLRYDSQAFALELEYARKLNGPDIAERSIAEMRRVGDFSEAQSKAWLAFMMQAFPNVGAQDRLTGLHDGRGGVRFFFNGKQTAATQDKDYARLFFGIWLSPKTSAPALRASLIGQA